ncbi:BppU family phage baseplate upper protein [Mammaliicoccus sciuri]|uniref:BppU family phage baseplate upper protein n=1 Tax=Mammaliicoccus sciuri TaxID=1296 RepID=UPI0028881118|nr:BppU family phage baseplate upper protein [Mammaliicoccus sciuri]MDT0694769.1 BppU family phage baseplate upper protein [Mammaliicoccus sciuri]
MPMNKIAKTSLDINAYYKDIKKLNVEFYNQDIGTAKIQFQITRDNAPMLLSEINTDSYIVLVTSNESRKVDNLVFEDELNGIVSYTLPNDVLTHVGKVLGEVYITRKGVEDTVVVRTFEFSIKDALINTISGDTKLSYIRKFEDLLTLVKNRATQMEEALANLDDYVSKVNEASENALNSIGVKKDETIIAIENEKNEIIELLTNDALLKVNDFETYKQNINNQMSAFNDTLEEKTKDKATEQDLVNKINSLKTELINYSDGKKDAKVVPLTLINGATLTSGGIDSSDNITLTYFSIGKGYYFCQLNGWVMSPQIGDITQIPSNLKIVTKWNEGWDVPQRSSLNYTGRIYVRNNNTVGLIKLDSFTLPFSLDPISFIAKGVE